MDQIAGLPEPWDIDRLAAYLGVGRRFVYRLTEQRRIRFLRVGGKLRFDPADVADYLAREAQAAAPEAHPALERGRFLLAHLGGTTRCWLGGVLWGRVRHD